MMKAMRKGKKEREIEKSEGINKPEGIQKPERIGMEFFYDELRLPEDKDILISERFCEKGEPILWKIKAITEDGFLKVGKTADKWASLCVASVSVPDLKDKGLWESYGARCGEDALKEMLCPGEYLRLLEAVKKQNDFPSRQAERKAEAKNAFRGV